MTVDRKLMIKFNGVAYQKKAGYQLRTVLNPCHLKEGYKEKMDTFEKTMILEALSECEGNQSAAARLLKITERRLRSRLEKLGLKNPYLG